MKERPILFSGPMIGAILDARKSQTRRVVKPQPSEAWTSQSVQWVNGDGFYCDGPCISSLRCPYGARARNRLWVRECCHFYAHGDPSSLGGIVRNQVVYRADPSSDEYWAVKWRPSIHMPRWASRIDLEVLDVRVERVRGISAHDAVCEGVHVHSNIDPCDMADEAKDNFRDLWDSINGKPKPRYGRDDEGNRVITHYESFPWEGVQEVREFRGKPWNVCGNPWVWVVEFERAAK